MVLGKVLLYSRAYSRGICGKNYNAALAAGFYANTEHSKNQVRLAYVPCKQDLQKVLVIFEKALE